MLSSLNNVLIGYLEDFNFVFTNDIFDKFFKEIMELTEETNKKKNSIITKYNEQIMEIKSMIEDDENYSHNLQSIIENLEEEKLEKLNECQKTYDNKISLKRNTFKSSYLTNNPSLSLIQEKFKVEMFNTIKDLIYSGK